jgi:hypothetical protein
MAYVCGIEVRSLTLKVEFNKAALSLAESFPNPSQKKSALNRLLKVRLKPTHFILKVSIKLEVLHIW